MSENASRLQATVEDYHSDAEHTPQANISTKRSSEMRQSGKDKPADILSDVATDSGYSSRTAATMSSADYAESSHSASRSKKSPPAPVPTARPVATESPRKKPSQPSKTKTEKEIQKEKAKPEKAKADKPRSDKPRRPSAVVNQSEIPSRSKSSSHNAKTRTQSDRDYQSYDRHDDERRTSRSKVTPIDTDRDQRRRPSHHETPRSPVLTRTNSTRVTPGAYPTSPTYIEPAHTRTHRSSSIASRPRPVSFHSDPAQYPQVRNTANVDNARGPPVSNPAYVNYPTHPIPQGYVGQGQGHTAPTHGFYHGQVPIVPQSHPAPYGYSTLQQQQQQQHISRNPDPTYSTRTRPTSIYGTPVISQNISQQPTSMAGHRNQSDGHVLSARYPSHAPAVHAPYAAHAAASSMQGAFSDSSEYDTEDEEAEQYAIQLHEAKKAAWKREEERLREQERLREAALQTALMPPPPGRPIYHRGPETFTYGQLGTSPAREQYLRHEKEYHPEEFAARYAPRPSSYYPASRRPSQSSSSNRTKTTYSSGSSRNPATLDGRQGRRTSYIAPEPPFYEGSDYESEEIEDYHYQDERRPKGRRPSQLRTRTESNVRKSGGMQAKLKEATKHQRADEGELITASDTLLRTKAKSGVPIGYLAGEAHRSSDTKSQTSHRSHRTSMTNGGFTLQITGKDESGDMQVHLSGDMEGQMVTVQPTGAVIIGNTKGTDKQYHASGKSVQSTTRSMGRSNSTKGSSRGSVRNRDADASRAPGRHGRGRRFDDIVPGA